MGITIVRIILRVVWVLSGLHFDKSEDKLKGCFEKENNSIYYNLCNEKIIKLSNERNHYINLLSIAIEKLKIITDINETLEQEFISYSNTPTIAADK